MISFKKLLFLLLITTFIFLAACKPQANEIEPNASSYTSQANYDHITEKYLLKYHDYYVAKLAPKPDQEYGLFYRPLAGDAKLIKKMGFAPQCDVLDEKMFYIDAGHLNSINLEEPYKCNEFPLDSGEENVAVENFQGHDVNWIYCGATKWGKKDGQIHRINIYIAVKKDGSIYKEIDKKELPSGF